MSEAPEEREPSTQRYQADVYQQKSIRDWALEIAIFVVIVGTLIATGFAAHYSGEQATIAQDNENKQIRAYVTLKDIRFEKRNDDTYDIIPQWENNGNSETVGMQAYLSRYLSDTTLPKGFSNGDFPGNDQVPTVLGPKAVNNATFGRIAKTCLLQFNRRDGLQNFYLWGWTSYHDIMTKEQHVTRFCWSIDQVVIDANGQISRVSHNLCNEGNCAENDCVAPTEKLTIAIKQGVCKDPPTTAPPPPEPTKSKRGGK